MDAGNLLDKVSDNVSVRRAFGAAYEKDGTLIIPVALVAGGGGAGTSRTGRGHRATGDRPEADDPAHDAAHDAAPQDPEPKDAGGGFGGLVLPSGVYVVKGDQVRWVPAVDTTIVVLASLGLVRLLARAWTRRHRPAG
ncbi:MAG TPA: spore germination protein GerW family protein [Streptosporangiaceae bacterium]|nr:spore germination protein GerW family protein [Streptosporangiaceae bacterium]